jgi:hypothetical protein
MSNFGTVKTRVQSLIIDDNPEVVAEIPNFVNKANSDAWSTKGLLPFREIGEGALSLGQWSYGKATAFNDNGFSPFEQNGHRGDPYTFTSDIISMPLAQVSESYFFANYAPSTSTTGRPEYWAETRSSILIHPMPDVAYLLIVPCWMKPDVHASDGDTDWVFDNAAEYLIWKAAAYAFEFNRDFEASGAYHERADREWKRVRRITIQGDQSRSMDIYPAAGSRIGSKYR